MKNHLLSKAILAMGDILILFGGFLLAYYLRFSLPIFPSRPIPPFDLYFNFAFLVALIGFSMVYLSGLYRIKHPIFKMEDFFLLFRAISLTLLIVMAMSFALRGYTTRYDIETYSRLIIVLAWGVDLIVLALWRWGFLAFQRYRLRCGKGMKRIIIVGVDETARNFHRATKKMDMLGYQPLGFLANGESKAELDHISNTYQDIQILGNTDDLSSVLKTEHIDEVMLASKQLDSETIISTIQACKRADTQFSIIPNFFEILMHQMRVEEVADIPIFQLDEGIFHRSGRFLKRGLDIVCSLLVLTLLAPVYLILAICIRLDSKGPVLFRQARIGKGERVFHTYKFRSMCVDAEERLPHILKKHDVSNDGLVRIADDPRVTRLGRFMRRFSLDELPQLINVLKGEMSWIGPRPHTVDEVNGYADWHFRRYDVLPGITGLTQVSGRKDLSLDEMARLDIYYIENWSPVLDLQILLRTIPTVLNGRGAY